MTVKVLVFIILICMIFVIPISALNSVSMIKFPLKPSPSTGPYQDDQFFELANETIYSLSNQTVPNGTFLRNIQSIQQNLAKMNISPDNHILATRLNNYLYYTGVTGSEYQAALSLTDKPYSPVYNDESKFADANLAYAAATRAWDRIKDLYPDVTMYTLPGIDTTRPFSFNEDTTRVFPWGTPTPAPLI